MTGFRDAEMQKALVLAGYTVGDTVTKKTVALFVADKTKKTTKTAAAEAAGIAIYGRDQLSAFLSTP
jgi:hypothetical protein